MKKFESMAKISAVILAFFVLLTTAYAARAESYITDPSQLPDQDAYKAVVKIKVYTSHDKENLTWYAAGSGIVISPSGVILTNYHVVTIEDEFNEGEYDSGYRICLSSEIDQVPDCNYVAKLIAKDEDSDLALLKMEPIPGLSTQSSSFKYLNLAASDNTGVNDDTIIMGYPGIGGETITITKGIISGKEEKYGNKWIKTDALSSFGSSGGAAMDMNGNIIGIVSQSHSDYLGSVGYLLNSASIYEWVNAYKNLAPQNNIYLEDIKSFAVKEKQIKNNNSFSNEYFSITKPSDWTFVYDDENQIAAYNESDDDSGYVLITMFKYPYKLSLDVVKPAIEDSLARAAALTVANINKNESININGVEVRKVILSGAGQTNTFYYFINNNYLMEIDYDYGTNSQDENTVEEIIHSLTLTTNNHSVADPQTYNHTSPNFSLKTSDGWHILELASKEKPMKLYNPKYPESYIYVSIEKGDENTKNYDNEEYLNYLQENFDTANNAASVLDASVEILDQDTAYKLNNELNNVLYVDNVYKKLSTDTILLHDIDNVIKVGDKRVSITFRMFSNDEAAFNSAWTSAQKVINTFSLTSSPVDPSLPDNNDEDNDQNEEPAEETPQTPNPEYKPPVATGTLSNRLKGYILLQVEKNGEAWYVKPESGYRIYMKNGEAAYGMMRDLGLGITDADLAKIPVGVETRFSEQDTDGDGLGDKLEEGLKTNPNNSDSDGDGYSDGTEVLSGYDPLGPGKLNYNYSLVNQLRGKILLQVESKGEAWYINPDDGKRYYMKDGDSSYQIMRYLSLGISNGNLEQIPEE